MLFALTIIPIKNPNNLNDNTSGILLALQFRKEKDVAIILSDNEEKLFKEGIKKTLCTIEDKNKLFINLDCVGFGQYLSYDHSGLTKEEKNLFKNIFKEAILFKAESDYSKIKEQGFRCINLSRISKRWKGVFKQDYLENMHTPADTIINDEYLKDLYNKLLSFMVYPVIVITPIKTFNQKQTVEKQE